MNLRTRFALITAGTVLVLSIALSAGAYGIASRQLQTQIDDSLQGRARRIVRMLERPDFFPGDILGREIRDEILQTELDAITQINVPGGGPVGRRGNPVLPTTKADRAMSARGRGARFSTFSFEGSRYRVLTVATANGTLVKLAKDSSIVDQARRGMQRWFPVLTSLAVLLAGFIGWLFARRVSRPIENLAGTAEAIADTQDLSRQITVKGRDEVAQLATSFNTMLEALRSSVSRQQQLVQDASHELRTPLTSLRANTELLQRSNLSDDDRTSILEDMRAEVDELVSLSAELSALATDQRTVEDPQKVDLADVAGEVAARAGRRTQSEITVTATADTVVEARPNQLERAISNLVDNAIKFSGRMSRVEIAVGAHRIEVRDNGPGIPDDEKALIFDRFYRSTSTRSMPGSGLGLAIVKQFALDHGAHVYVLDNAGGGTIVGIQFPLPAR